ncbi:MAG TPA: hypothetical protein QGF58_24510 [Myxococcota bacterium]|nr:hypothetical protein [Myxococcota bacterium]
MLLILGIACKGCGSSPEEVVYEGDWTEPTWDFLEGLELPEGDEGLVLAQTDGVELILDPDKRDPAVSAAQCLTTVMVCHDPELRNIRGCLENVPHCETRTPWEDGSPWCCPEECVDAYLELRAAGESEIDALTDAIYTVPGSCAYGFDDHVEAL